MLTTNDTVCQLSRYWLEQWHYGIVRLSRMCSIIGVMLKLKVESGVTVFPFKLYWLLDVQRNPHRNRCVPSCIDIQTNVKKVSSKSMLSFPRFTNKQNWKNTLTNKKYSENADTSTSVTFDLVVWPWPFVKVKKADVIWCHLLYCTLVPGTRYDVYGFNTLRNITICLFYVTFDLHLWPFAFVKVT